MSCMVQLRNNVVALRAVDMKDLASAPKFLAMQVAKNDPTNPIVEKSIMTVILAATLQVRFSTGKDNSLYVPGWLIKSRPSRKSPVMVAATAMATSVIEYMPKLNSSGSTLYSFMIDSDILEIAPAHINAIVYSKESKEVSACAYKSGDNILNG